MSAVCRKNFNVKICKCIRSITHNPAQNRIRAGLWSSYDRSDLKIDDGNTILMNHALKTDFLQPGCSQGFHSAVGERGVGPVRMPQHDASKRRTRFRVHNMTRHLSAVLMIDRVIKQPEPGRDFVQTHEPGRSAVHRRRSFFKLLYLTFIHFRI